MNYFEIISFIGWFYLLVKVQGLERKIKELHQRITDERRLANGTMPKSFPPS